jgi:hypothetical protein
MRRFLVVMMVVVGFWGLVLNTACKKSDRVQVDEVEALTEESVELIENYIDGIGNAGSPGQTVEAIRAFSEGWEKLDPRINGLLALFSADEAKPTESESRTMAKLLTVLMFRRNLVAMDLKKFADDPEVQKAREELKNIQRKMDPEATTIDREKVRQEYVHLIEGRIKGGEGLERFSRRLGQASLTSKMKITINILLSTGKAIQSFVGDYEYAPEVGSLEELRYYKNFVPLYMASLPTRDAWGNPLHYKAEGSRFWIGSGGSDGQFAGFDQEGDYTDWQDKDIILSGDSLVYGPRMAEQ